MALLFVLPFSAAILFLGMHTGHCADIVNGKESVPHSRPYMAALFRRGNVFECGGTLISRNWVLTAAHCSINRGDTVILGAHSLLNLYEKGKQRFHVIQAIRHRFYNPETLANDIMLLQLNGRARLGQYVQTIHLPKTYEDVKAGTQCLVAGWGASSFQGKIYDKLREVYINIEDRGICKKTYVTGIVTTNHLCAAVTKQRKSTCSGDSGGPIICQKTQRGITSFSPMNQCAVPGKPHVYIRLTKEYLLWIQNIIRG